MIRRTMLAAVAAAAIGAFGGAPSASAHCTVNLGTCYGHCTINTGYCGSHGGCTVNTSVCLSSLLICTGDLCDIH